MIPANRNNIYRHLKRLAGENRSLFLQSKPNLLDQHQYKTIASTGESIFKDRGSKFLGRAEHCTTEQQAKNIIDSLRKANPQAVHVCSAFRFGSDKKHFRSSDDGEPNNSAGPPILGQIQSFDLTNVLITVVRYYGGVNLGVGGLINAYRTAAREALEDALIVMDEDKYCFTLSFDYEQLPKVMHLLKGSPAKLLEQDFHENCIIRFSLKSSELSFIERIKNLEKTHLQNESHRP